MAGGKKVGGADGAGGTISLAFQLGGESGKGGPSKVKSQSARALT